MTIKITYDQEADAAYIYLKKPGNTVARTLPITDNLLIDFGKKGQILGIEILSASRHLSKKDLRTSRLNLITA